MHKHLLLILTFLILSACTSKKDIEMLYNPVKGIESGAWQIALLVEANTNFSSLLYDKTEAKIDSFSSKAFMMLPDDGYYYIMPTIGRDDYGKIVYDEGYSKLIANYIRLNGYGISVEHLEDADYIIMANVEESFERVFGTNTSSVTITILEPDETVVYYSKVDVKSSSDKNFYYYPSKSAKPVKYLTLKGFEKIFKDGMPQAFS